MMTTVAVLVITSMVTFTDLGISVVMIVITGHDKMAVISDGHHNSHS